MECCGRSLVGGALVDGVLWAKPGGWGIDRQYRSIAEVRQIV